MGLKSIGCEFKSGQQRSGGSITAGLDGLQSLKHPLRVRVRWLTSSLNTRAGAAVLAGTALALAFPLPGWAGLAWVAPGLLLAATLGTRGWRAFRLGWAGGFVFALIALRWLLQIPFPAGAVAGWLALSAYVGAFIAAWVWLCQRFFLWTVHREETATNFMSRCAAAPTDAEPAAANSVSVDSARSWPECFVQLGWLNRTAWAFACAGAWVAMEIVLGRLFSGFPWNFLGTSQYKLTPLIQMAEVTGVYGVSFVVVWMSAALCCAAMKVAVRLTSGRVATDPDRTQGTPFFLARPQAGRFVSLRLALFADLAIPLVVLLMLAFAGGLKLVRPSLKGDELRVALVQPGIPQTLIFDPKEVTNRFNTLMELSQLAAATRPDLLVWPEASLPDFSEGNYRLLTNFVQSHRLWMILGADDSEERTARTGPRYDFYNAAFLVNPQGQFVATYRKQRLVIFGEYVPLADWLPFTKYLTPIQGSFAAGPGPVTFEVGERPAKIAPLICFEDVFPHGARQHVQPDTDFLLNLTNNGWFGEGSAQWQHGVAAVFRAVENGIPLVRCTNNGLTCWIDERGRLREFGLGDPSDIYSPGFTTYRIPLQPKGQPRPPTFYHEYGDVFGWTCIGVTAGVFVLASCRRWR